MMNTIERVLPTEQTETEFFNQQRAKSGREPIAGRVTKIREGMHKPCGPDCKIHQVGSGWFSVSHGEGCTIRGFAGKTETVGDGTGQACGRVVDNDGSIIQGVLVLSGLFPHES